MVRWSCSSAKARKLGLTLNGMGGDLAGQMADDLTTVPAVQEIPQCGRVPSQYGSQDGKVAARKST